jgi:hypothetical protein
MSLRHGLTDPAELAAYLPLLKGYRGIALVREAAPLISARAESPKESELRHYWLEAGLPPPLVNGRSTTPRASSSVGWTFWSPSPATALSSTATGTGCGGDLRRTPGEPVG